MCKQLGLAMPVKLQSYQQPGAPEYPPPPPPLRFPSHQDKEKQAQAPVEQPTVEGDVKPDVKIGDVMLKETWILEDAGNG